MGIFKHAKHLSISRTAVEHNVSFDLTTAPRPRSSSIMPIVPPRASVRVPMEIILNIVELAYYNEQLEADDALLARCARVCKEWSAPVQALLFSHVKLRSSRAYVSFMAAISSKPHLAESVVRMRAVIDYNQSGRLFQRSLGRAVSVCPNLFEIDLSVFGPSDPALTPSFDDKTLSLISSGPRLSALHFNNASGNDRLAGQLLSAFSSLSFLSLSGVLPCEPASGAAPFLSQLDELRVNFQASPCISFSKWLLECSRESLRALELVREPSADLLQYLVGHHGHTLESLALPACHTREHVQSVNKCENLRELRTEGQVAPAVYKALPRHVRHISIGLEEDSDIKAVLQLVRTSDELEQVTVQMWQGGEKNVFYSSLKIACAMRGISLDLVHDIRMFRSSVRGDHLPSASFPRHKSVNNLYRMRMHSA